MLVQALEKRNCPKELRAVEKKGRYEVYRRAMDEAIRVLFPFKGISQAIEAAGAVMKEGYMREDALYSWLVEKRITNDLACIRRALEEVPKDGMTIVDKLIWCTLPVNGFDGELKTGVDLVLKDKTGKFKAVIFNMGKCHRGPSGRTLKTQARGNLSCVVAKGVLERRYPGVEIWDVYLSSPRDTELHIDPAFYQSQTADSQKQILSYQELYTGSAFDWAKYEAFFSECIEKGIPEPNCILCEHSYECKQGLPALNPHYEEFLETPEEKKYKLPDYTKEQRAIINHRDGAFLVVAGPGSGKTATLVGRLHHLVRECGVPPEFLLAITFTKKAANEIRSRCTFLEEGEEIHISTLNALGYQILIDHAKEARIEPCRLLTPDINYTIVDSLLDSLGTVLPGFSYARRDGDTGLVATVIRRIGEYQKDRFGFREKYPELTYL